MTKKEKAFGCGAAEPPALGVEPADERTSERGESASQKARRRLERRNGVLVECRVSSAGEIEFTVDVEKRGER